MQNTKNFIQHLVLVLCAAAVVFMITPSVSAEDFTVVALPDTQNYSESYPQIYNGQTQWTADNAASLNIKFVTHLGDLVNHAATASEWNNAHSAMATLDNAGMPYGTCVGNHDILYPGDYYDPAGVNYLGKFSPAKYAGKPWFGGASPSGLSNYQIISVNGREFLFLHLLIETPPQELAWAQEILNANQEKATWVSTHRYLFDWMVLGAGRYDEFNYTFEAPYRHDGIPADTFFHNFVAPNRQIYMVYCGHNHSEYRQTSKNNFGLTVHEVLADYQDDPNGGNGWLRINTIRPDADRIDVQSYSPYLDQYRTGGDSRFSLGVDFDAYTSGAPFITFQQGVAGYAGTRDTWIKKDSGNSSYGSSSVIVVDNDTENSLWGDYEGQGLIKFTDLFQGPVSEGDPAPTRIPQGATIVSAKMSLALKDDVDSPTCDNLDFYVYRMTRDWSESSTWNSMGGGISVGSETHPSRVASFSGDNSPDSDYTRTLDIKSAVQAWAGGSPNYGLAIFSEDIDWCDDGIEIYSSEHGASAERPKLTIEFSYDIANVAPAITRSLFASQVTLTEGQEADLTMAAQDPNPLDPLVFWLNGQEIGYATGTGSVTHTALFEQDGTYTFTGQVEDDETKVGAGTVTITVSNAPPVILELTQDLVIDVGRRFEFNVSASDPGAFDTVSAQWDLDEDGDYDDHTGFGGAHWYDSPGVQTVRVRVADDDGGQTLGQFIVTVKDLGADGDFDNDGTGVDPDSHSFVDPDDEDAFGFCSAGQGLPPSPPSPYVPQNCLSAFDADNDGDVDEDDRALLLGMAEPVPVPALDMRGGKAMLVLVLMVMGIWHLKQARKKGQPKG